MSANRPLPSHIGLPSQVVGQKGELSLEVRAAQESLPVRGLSTPQVDRASGQSQQRNSTDEELVLHGDGYAIAEADEFCCGTVTGAWHLFAGSLLAWPTAQVLGILDVRNKQPGNGQFKYFLQQLIGYCQQHEYDLAFTDVGNPGLYKHLVARWGFQKANRPDVVILSCYSVKGGNTTKMHEQAGALL